MIDITEFSDLGSVKKTMLRDIFLKIHETNELDKIRSYANLAFSIIAPDGNLDLLRSSTKDFRVLGTTVEEANAGLHVARTWIAHEVQRARRAAYWNRFLASKDFERNGVVAIPNFFSEHLVTRLEREIETIERSVSKNVSNIISHMRPDTLALREAVFGKSFGGVSDLRAIVFDCLAFSVTHQEARMQYAENTFVQRLHNKRGDGDVQKTLHQDTFFPCLKFWYFPKEVTLKDGPLTYAPGSNHLTYKRLQNIYEQSIVCARGDVPEERTYGHMEGSLRVTDQELEDMGLEAIPLSVQRNTLVIANVFGLHRRSEVEQEGFRDSIHGSIRISTPFGE